MEKTQVRFKLYNILLWSFQVLLAVTFLWAGYVKLFLPVEELNRMWPWTVENSLMVTIAGIADILAGIGIICPRLIRIWPDLTIYACYGMILLMTIAILFHISRDEFSQLGINFVIIILAALVIFLWKHLIKLA